MLKPDPVLDSIVNANSIFGIPTGTFVILIGVLIVFAYLKYTVKFKKKKKKSKNKDEDKDKEGKETTEGDNKDDSNGEK